MCEEGEAYEAGVECVDGDASSSVCAPIGVDVDVDIVAIKESERYSSLSLGQGRETSIGS